MEVVAISLLNMRTSSRFIICNMIILQHPATEQKNNNGKNIAEKTHLEQY